jgi:hypothetical protein
MGPQRNLLDARKKLELARKDLVRKIQGAVASAEDHQLMKVAAFFWPEPKKGPSPKKANGASRKRTHPVQTVTPESAKNAAAGRAAVTRGERPPLKTAIIQVMGERTMNATMIVEALEAKKWLPESNDPRQYISYMLSSNTPVVFERAGRRGFYRVVTSRSKVTTKRVWGVIRSKSRSSFTLAELAMWMGCEMNRLRSIVSKLQQQQRLVRDGTKRPSIYKVNVK